MGLLRFDTGTIYTIFARRIFCVLVIVESTIRKTSKGASIGAAVKAAHKIFEKNKPDSGTTPHEIIRTRDL